MGIVYTLVKKNVPKAFTLGKGPWDQVFERKYDKIQILTLTISKNGNCEEPFIVNEKKLKNNIQKFGPQSWKIENISDNMINRIINWAKDSKVFLINYWEDIEYFQEINDRVSCESEYTDLKELLVTSLFDYKITSTIWDN